MKRVWAGLMTAIIMGMMTWTALYRSPTSSRSSTDSGTNSRLQSSRFLNTFELEAATNCIDGLLSAARAGDVASYLDVFGGPLRERLEREAGELGRDVFARRLRSAALARKSHAVFAPEALGDRLDRAAITVESTFADRIERQTFRLEHGYGRWLVTDVDTVREHVPQVPLGSLAKFEEPEGAPVTSGPDPPASDEIEN